MKNRTTNFSFHVTCLFGLAFLMFVYPAKGQSDPDDEVLLTFSHPAVGQVYISAVIFGEVAFLPVGELLDLFEISSEQVIASRGLRGNYPTSKDYWEINPTTRQLRLGNSSVELGEDLLYLGELDLYLHPKVINDVFGMNFTFFMSTLSLSLTSSERLPIEERRKRELTRSRSLQYGKKSDIPIAPLLYPRNRKMLRMGMVDYNINQTFTPGEGITQGLFNVGLEAFGGDMMGTLNVIRSDAGVQAQLNGLRWRYVLPAAMEPTKNVALTSVSAGDMFTGVRSNIGSIVGISLTNDPIVPRQELDLFVIDGYTEPDSEVELLLGGQMADFTQADELGYYRFNTPINFGAQRLSIRIYTPQGKVIQEDRQIQIPYTFLPRGFVSYTLQTGLQRFGMDSVGSDLTAHTNVAYGISNSLTARAGTDYNFSKNSGIPYSFVGLSARVFQQYLLNADIVPRRYALADASVFFPNNTNITAQFKEYFQDSVFNSRNNIRDLSLNIFWPFRILGRPSGLRIGGTRNEGATQSRNTILGDFNTQVGRMVARFNFRGNLNEFHFSEEEMGYTDFRGVVTSSFTYTLSRSPGVPIYVRGMFLRGQLVYNPFMRAATNYGFLLSQTLFKRGRFTVGYDRNLIMKSGRFQVGFLYDFKFFRSSSQYQSSGKDYGMMQSLTGSLAYDPTGVIIPGNRDQVNRAGVAVKLFIDDNNNGVHDEDEYIVSAKAARLDRSAAALIGSDGILRLSQLQNYWTYRMEIDRNALPDPTLAPKQSTFSFVVDPNHYRMIEVPLYRTGTIEGSVLIPNEQDELVGVGGLRLFLRSEDDKTETIRTFSDGSFYTYGVIPGKYTLKVDPKQLTYIGLTSDPGTLEFDINAVPDGEYLEGLDFVLIEGSIDSLSTTDAPLLSIGEMERIDDAITLFLGAQKLLKQGQLEAALEAINQSIDLVETPQGIFLKASIYLEMGEELAEKYLKLAEEKCLQLTAPDNKSNEGQPDSENIP